MKATSETMAGNEYGNIAEEGDVIRVPQYKGALKVNYVSEMLVGVEFVDADKNNSTRKSMVINENSGNLYLMAGNTDKGKVNHVDILA